MNSPSFFPGLGSPARANPSAPPSAAHTGAAYCKCRLCLVKLDPDEEDDFGRLLCDSCKTRPEAKRLGPVQVSPPAAPQVKDTAPAREFTVAERSMIRKIHCFVPTQQLLDLLNERLACDLGPEASPYTVEQLHVAIAELGAAGQGGHAKGLGAGWASLRQVLSQARRAGVLDLVNEQVIADFAVVFQLNAKQVLNLKDILLNATQDRALDGARQVP